MARADRPAPRDVGADDRRVRRYHYSYDSGREGEACRIGFAPRKADTGAVPGRWHRGHAELLARLGKHKTGKGCLYIRRLADIDMAVAATTLD